MSQSDQRLSRSGPGVLTYLGTKNKIVEFNYQYNLRRNYTQWGRLRSRKLGPFQLAICEVRVQDMVMLFNLDIDDGELEVEVGMTLAPPYGHIIEG